MSWRSFLPLLLLHCLCLLQPSHGTRRETFRQIVELRASAHISKLDQQDAQAGEATILNEHQDLTDNFVVANKVLLNSTLRKARAAMRLAEWRQGNPRSELGRIMENFHEFKEHLLRSGSLFVELCSEVVGNTLSKQQLVSCGNTLSCFLKLFGAFHEEFVPRDETMQLAAARQPEKASRLLEFDYPKLHLEELVLDISGQEYLLDLARIHWEKLSEELKKEDEMNALPRIFDINMEWKKIVKQHVLKWSSEEEDGLTNFEVKICRMLVSKFALTLEEPSLRQSLQEHFAGERLLNSCAFSGLLDAIKQSLSEMFQKSSSVIVKVPHIHDFKAELTIEELEYICAQSGDDRNIGSTQVDEGFVAFSDTCRQLRISESAVWTPSPEFQNHEFAVVKHENKRFSIVQGYAAGDEPGYDLKQWLQSPNEFAAVHGIDETLMLQFIKHLQVFVENGMTRGTFDGDNHAATFNVHENRFVGEPYFSFFNFFEIGKTQAVGAGQIDVRTNLINPILQSMECAAKKAEGITT